MTSISDLMHSGVMAADGNQSIPEVVEDRDISLRPSFSKPPSVTSPIHATAVTSPNASAKPDAVAQQILTQPAKLLTPPKPKIEPDGAAKIASSKTESIKADKK